jgi:two-component system chemotaxis response regulator CheB
MIVDDSSVARAVLTRMIMAQDGFQVVAAAASASEALSLLRCISVDIILLDIEMPGGSGLEALPALIEAGRGARVLIVSSAADDRASASMRALSMGAADTIAKPGTGMFGGRFSEILCERLRRIGANSVRDPDAPPAAPATPILLREVHDWRPACIAIGASTGGIHAINEFLAGLPDEIGLPIFVTQHLPPLFMPFFARQLAAPPAAAHASWRRARPSSRTKSTSLPATRTCRLERRGSRVRSGSMRLRHRPAVSPRPTR